MMLVAASASPSVAASIAIAVTIAKIQLVPDGDSSFMCSPVTCSQMSTDKNHPDKSKKPQHVSAPPSLCVTFPVAN